MARAVARATGPNDSCIARHGGCSTALQHQGDRDERQEEEREASPAHPRGARSHEGEWRRSSLGAFPAGRARLHADAEPPRAGLRSQPADAPPAPPGARLLPVGRPQGSGSRIRSHQEVTLRARLVMSYSTRPEQFELSMLGGTIDRRYHQQRAKLDFAWGSLAEAKLPPELLEEARAVWTRLAFVEYRSAA